MRTISESALKSRINRKLAHQWERLRTARGERAVQEVGRFFVVNIHTGNLEATDQDLEALGRELGVLKAHETLAI